MRKFLKIDSSPLELLLIYQGIRFGLVLLVNNPFTASGSFLWMSQIADATTWGIVFVGTELLRLIAVHTKLRTIRRLAAIASVFLWSVVSYLFLLSNPLGTAAATYTTFALMSIWVLISPSESGRKV